MVLMDLFVDCYWFGFDLWTGCGNPLCYLSFLFVNDSWADDVAEVYFELIFGLVVVGLFFSIFSFRKLSKLFFQKDFNNFTFKKISIIYQLIENKTYRKHDLSRTWLSRMWKTFRKLTKIFDKFNVLDNLGYWVLDNRCVLENKYIENFLYKKFRSDSGDPFSQIPMSFPTIFFNRRFWPSLWPWLFNNKC